MLALLSVLSSSRWPIYPVDDYDKYEPFYWRSRESNGEVSPEEAIRRPSLEDVPENFWPIIAEIALEVGVDLAADYVADKLYKKFHRNGLEEENFIIPPWLIHKIIKKYHFAESNGRFSGLVPIIKRYGKAAAKEIGKSAAGEAGKELIHAISGWLQNSVEEEENGIGFPRPPYPRPIPGFPRPPYPRPIPVYPIRPRM